MGRANVLGGGVAVVSRLRRNGVGAGGCDVFRAETARLRGDVCGRFGGVAGGCMAVRL
jgi:hypothetical protein